MTYNPLQTHSTVTIFKNQTLAVYNDCENIRNNKCNSNQFVNQLKIGANDI